MFVYVYQLVTKPLISKILPKERCPACEKTGHIEITLYQKYVTAYYWIPVSGAGMNCGARCTLCGHTIKAAEGPIFAKKKWSDSLDEAMRALKSGYRRTLWQRVYPWSLSLVIVAGIIVVVIPFLVDSAFEARAARDREAKLRQYVMQPKPGDIYKVSWSGSSGPSTGTLVKVLRIDGDEMIIVRDKADIGDDFKKLSDAKAWAALPRDAAAFDPHEYSASLASLQGRERTGRFGELVVKSSESFSGHAYRGQLLPSYYGIHDIVERTEK